MWLLVFLLFIMTLLLGWTLFGYWLLIWFMGLLRQTPSPVFPDSWPFMSLIVPCYNEEEHILAKLEDIRKLEYPADCLEVVFSDGSSQDRTTEMLIAAIRTHEPIRVVISPCKGKIQQLNHALPQLRGEIIVNTDTDARLSADALKWIAAEFAANPQAGVVGAYCYPANTLAIEKYYWDAQNKGRFLENDAHTSSIVIAQCYAFRRELFESFPVDVIADDVYIAFLANTLGYRTVYSRRAIAVETRGPKNYTEFLPHKFRKSNAFLRESLRFLYRLPEMGAFCKMMLLTRIAQQLLLPWGLLLWILIAGSLLTLFRFDIVLLSTILLVSLFIAGSRVFAWVKLPDETRSSSFFTMVKGYILTTLIMLATGLSYPFFQQDSSYARLDSRRESECMKKEDDM